MIILILINILAVTGAVLVHYEFLVWITKLMPQLKIQRKFKIVFGVFTALVAHAVEVWIFAFAYYILHYSGNYGELTGNFNNEFLDFVYFSFTIFTSLGFGDIVPVGAIRYLTGIEALTGLVLVTWTASFLFIKMQKYWYLDHRKYQ